MFEFLVFDCAEFGGVLSIFIVSIALVAVFVVIELLVEVFFPSCGCTEGALFSSSCWLAFGVALCSLQCFCKTWGICFNLWRSVWERVCSAWCSFCCNPLCCC